MSATGSSSAARRWVGRFNLTSQARNSVQTRSTASGEGERDLRLQTIGYQNEESVERIEASASSTSNLSKQKQIMTKMSWALAMSTGKQLPMMFFMLWMSGSSVHIFSIMMTGMALMNPVKSLIGMSAAFEKIKVPGETINLTNQKLTYIAGILAGFALGAWKLNKMGLLPLTSADWASSMLEVRQPIEITG